MAERTKFNPKRRIRPVGAPLPFDLARIRYQGSPLHKSNPGDFGLDPPSAARPGKTLCDEAGIFTRAEAMRLLTEGAKRGLVSVAVTDTWPNNIWAVTEAGVPLEAQGDGSGIYHGYPMAANDPLREDIIERWRQ